MIADKHRAAPAIGDRAFMRDLRVLVIDDNAHWRRLIRDLLHAFGIIDVTEAQDGLDGLQKIIARPPDVALIDLAMPGLSGQEVVKRIRSPGFPLRHLPIVLVTGFCQKPDIALGLELGVREFVAKPIAPKILRDRILRAVAPHHFAPGGGEDLIELD